MPAGTRSRLPRIGDLGEFGLIRKLQRRFGRTGPSVIRGIGDDAAVLQCPPRRQLLVTTDLLTEGIHFDFRYTAWTDLGYKAAVANLSDIAAMGGFAQYCLVSLAVPVAYRVRDIEQLYHGLMEAARPHGVELIGGDTSASRHGLFLSITLIGSVPAGQALTRRGARPGDVVFVTGSLGDSQAGLTLLRDPVRRRAAGLAERHRRYLTGRHLRPSPRVSAGQVLSSLNLASAAIDVSDGLAGDLRHLCEQSDVGAEIDAERLPCSPALRAYAAVQGDDATHLALTGGEDYELLFTVHPSDVGKLRRIHRRLGCRFSRIGVIGPRRTGLRIRDRRGTRPLTVQGYEHFHNGRPSRHRTSR